MAEEWPDEAEPNEAESEPVDERSEARRASRRQSYRTVFWVVVPLLLLMAAFPLFVQLDWFGFRLRVLGLLVLGMVASVGLAAALMAASFHSARSGVDDESGVLPGELGGED